MDIEVDEIMRGCPDDEENEVDEITFTHIVIYILLYTYLLYSIINTRSQINIALIVSPHLYIVSEYVTIVIHNY